jgi:uncharacterized protein (TIGR02246 family)
MMTDQSQSDDERQIRELTAAWMRATREHDNTTVLDLMTDDVVFLRPGQPPMIGREAFSKTAGAQAGHDAPTVDGKSEVLEVQVLGDWAFMWTKLRVTMTPAGGGEATVREGNTLSVLRKQDGKWRIARDANLLAPV